MNESQLIFVEATQLELPIHRAFLFGLLEKVVEAVTVRRSFCIVSGSIKRTVQKCARFIVGGAAIKIANISSVLFFIAR